MNEILTFVGAIEDKQVKQGETNGKRWERITFKIGGKFFASFDVADLAPFKVGDVVEVKFTTDGRYNTIKEIKISQSEDKVSSGITNSFSLSKDVIIVRQSCLKAAIDAVNYEQYKGHDLLDLARKFEDWVWRE